MGSDVLRDFGAKLTKKFLTSFVAGGLGIFSGAAFAGCWNAHENGAQGPSVELCHGGRCEKTNMILECAGAWGATIRYANGWTVYDEIVNGAVSHTVTLNDAVVSAAQLQSLSCRDLDEDYGCRFPEPLVRSSASSNDDPMSLIEQHFINLLGVDAEHLQILLLEADLYHGAIDGRWGPRTEQAFRDALDWAGSRGVTFDFRSADAVFDLAAGVRAALFDVDSGLNRTPTGGEFLLVAASRRSVAEAEQVARHLDGRLTSSGYPSRVYILPAVNGWYAVVAGMYSRSGCVSQANRFKAIRLIPSDSYCAGLDRFDPFIWTN